MVLQVPIDLPAQAAPEATLAQRVAAPGPAPGPDDIEAVAELLAAAAFPVLLAGRGAVVSPGADAAIEELGAHAGALLATSAMAHGLFARQPFALGIAGGFASPLCSELAAQADVVVAFGAGAEPLDGAARRAVRRRRADRPGRRRPAGARAACTAAIGPSSRDAALAARAVTDALRRRGARRGPAPAPRRSQPRSRTAAGATSRSPTTARTSSSTRARSRSRSTTCSRPSARSPSTPVTSRGYPAMYLQVPDARGFVFPNAFQSVGLGLGAAIGAAVGRPDRVCVAALGDGGTMMALAEIETAVRYGLGVVIVIYDDAAYGAEVHHFGPPGHAVDLTQFADADFAAIGRAVGADGHHRARRRGPRPAARLDWRGARPARRGPSWSTPRSTRAPSPPGSRKRSAPTEAGRKEHVHARNRHRAARRPGGRRGRGRRPVAAAQRAHARDPAARAVREHARAEGARDLAVRRARPGLGLELARDRRARRHALRRAVALDLGPRQDRPRRRAARAPGRAGGRDRPGRRDRRPTPTIC